MSKLRCLRGKETRFFWFGGDYHKHIDVTMRYMYHFHNISEGVYSLGEIYIVLALEASLGYRKDELD